MIFDADEMNTMMCSMNKNMLHKIEDIESLKQEITGLIDEPLMQGKAYNNGKEYFRAVWLPLLTTMQNMCSSTIQANTRYMEEFHYQVDSSSHAYIDTDYLEEAILRFNRLKDIMMYEITQPAWMDMSLLDTVYSTTQLQDTIAKLHQFDGVAGSYYDEARYYHDVAKRGMSMLSKGNENTTINTFTISDKLQGWIDKVKANMKKLIYSDAKAEIEMYEKYLVEGCGDPKVVRKIIQNLKKQVINNAYQYKWKRGKNKDKKISMEFH